MKHSGRCLYKKMLQKIIFGIHFKTVAQINNNNKVHEPLEKLFQKKLRGKGRRFFSFNFLYFSHRPFISSPHFTLLIFLLVFPFYFVRAVSYDRAHNKVQNCMFKMEKIKIKVYSTIYCACHGCEKRRREGENENCFCNARTGQFEFSF